ncbi:hypothetical protein BS78_09G001700 [Paspalum vaginatum]|nr:hypothetical protein BS78_09G001700 [Paspalum vaginatum]
MATTHDVIMAWILQLLIDQFELQHQGDNHPYNLTATNGFFQLNLLPVPGWGREGEAQPLPLLFSLRDLYLVGFLHNNIWFLFDVADLRGTGLMEEQNLRHWKKLGFKGEYRGKKNESVLIGMPPLDSSYNVLSDYLQQMESGLQQQVENALYRIIVVVSEARRFPEWSNGVREVYATFQSKTVDAIGRKFALLFTQWNKICTRIIAGPAMFARFSALEGFAIYSDLLPSISVMLRSSTVQ